MVAAVEEDCNVILVVVVVVADGVIMMMVVEVKVVIGVSAIKDQRNGVCGGVDGGVVSWWRWRFWCWCWLQGGGCQEGFLFSVMYCLLTTSSLVSYLLALMKLPK